MRLYLMTYTVPTTHVSRVYDHPRCLVASLYLVSFHLVSFHLVRFILSRFILSGAGLASLRGGAVE